MSTSQKVKAFKREYLTPDNVLVVVIIVAVISWLMEII